METGSITLRISKELFEDGPSATCIVKASRPSRVLHRRSSCFAFNLYRGLCSGGERELILGLIFVKGKVVRLSQECPLRVPRRKRVNCKGSCVMCKNNRRRISSK